jgi:hypothetical protein
MKKQAAIRLQQSGLIKESKFALLNQEAIEVKRMLTIIIKRPKADC